MENDAELFGCGVVKVYYPLKGFGFITRDKGKDLFFFRSEVKDESLIVEGISVKFKIERHDKKYRATQIIRNG